MVPPPPRVSCETNRGRSTQTIDVRQRTVAQQRLAADRRLRLRFPRRSALRRRLKASIRRCPSLSICDSSSHSELLVSVLGCPVHGRLRPRRHPPRAGNLPQRPASGLACDLRRRPSPSPVHLVTPPVRLGLQRRRRWARAPLSDPPLLRSTSALSASPACPKYDGVIALIRGARRGEIPEQRSRQGTRRWKSAASSTCSWSSTEEPALESQVGCHAAYRRAVPRWGFTTRPFQESA